MNMSKDYYKILQVHPEAGTDIIKKAYKTLVVRHHPDKHHSSRKRVADTKFKEISEAYNVLNNPAKRRSYDKIYFFGQNGISGTANAEINEKAYYFFQKGLELYKKAQDKTIWRVFTGKTVSNLKKSRNYFLKIINEYSTSRYAESASFYNISILMEIYEYSLKHLDETEKRLYDFLSEFPDSKWMPQIKLLTARFYIFRKRKKGYSR